MIASLEPAESGCAAPDARTVYDRLVAELIAAMERGELVWHQPWFSRRPANLFTRKPYRGFNILWLNMAAKHSGYTSRYWVTERQAMRLHGSIKPDQVDKPESVLCFKWHICKTRDGSGRHLFIPRLMIRSFTVYNLDQTMGLERHVPEPKLDFHPVEAAEAIVKGYAGAPPIDEDDDHACYRPLEDAVGMPPRHAFLSVEEFYATLFHELVHSTGHPCRLGRFDTGWSPWEEREDYAREELVAELGAAFLCLEAGIGTRTAKNSAAYLQHWLKALRSDRRFLFRAAASAQKAGDWILGDRAAKAGTKRPEGAGGTAHQGDVSAIVAGSRPARHAFEPVTERKHITNFTRHQQQLATADEEDRLLVKLPSERDGLLHGQPGCEAGFAMLQVR